MRFDILDGSALSELVEVLRRDFKHLRAAHLNNDAQIQQVLADALEFECRDDASISVWKSEE